MNANLHHLELFYYVAKAKGVSQAAKIIPYGVQQPAISQQMKRLEEDLGVALFERRPFSLTPAGESLFKFLSKFFDNIDGELANLKGRAGVRLRFGCPSVISSHYLSSLIRDAVSKFPALRPCIYELDGMANVASLINRETDIAISFSIPERSSAMEIRPLYEFPMCIIAPKGHRFAGKGFWPKSDFASERWIAVQESSGGTHELRVGLSQFGLAPEFSASTNSVEAALDYVELGLGLALMAMPPPDMLKGRAVECIPCKEIFGSLALSVAWLKDCHVDDKILNFIAKSAKERAERLMESKPSAALAKRSQAGR